MASLCKRATSKYFVACFTADDGRQLKRSTKTTDRKLALQLANRYETAYQKLRTEDQARRVLADIHEDITGQKLDSASAEDFLNRWVNAGASTLSPRTRAKYAGVVKQFLASIGSKAKTDLALITVSDVAKFRDGLAARLSIGTANLALKIVRVGFGEAVRQGVAVTNAAAKVKVLKKRPSETEVRRPFTLSEVKKLLAVANKEWKGMILVGLYTGQRLGDIARLTWQNIDLEEDELRFVTRKSGRRQAIPLAAPLRKYIETLPSCDDPKTPLFPDALAKLASAKNEEAGALSNQFREILESVGLAEARVQDHSKRGQGRSARRTVSEISFHCLRHTATSLLKNAGVSDVVAREIIGHDSEMVSRNYTHIETDTLRNAVNLLPDVTGVLPKVKFKKGGE